MANRDLPQGELLAAAQRLSAEIQAATETVQAAERNVTRQTGAQRGGAAPARARAQAAQETTTAEQGGLKAELDRLEVLKAQTAELQRQKLIVVEQRSGPTAGQQLAAEERAARTQAAIRGPLQTGPLVSGRGLGGVAIGQAPYSPRAAGDLAAAEEAAARGEATRTLRAAEIASATAEETTVVREMTQAEIARLSAVRQGLAAINASNAEAQRTAASERQVREANIAAAQQQAELIAARAKQISNLAALGPGVRQEAQGYLFPGAPGPNAAAASAAARTAAGGILPVSFSEPKGASPYSIFANDAEARKASSNIARAREDIQRLGLVQAEASQQMRRHGALTTEFLQALARGETTLSEFRFQIGSTIAKFGGWTLAAASVYGALAAIQKLGSGARESANGVATLQRFFEGRGAFNADQARGGFRDVSRDLNVPIKDVVDTQSQFARVFHNQADSLTATRVALTATKLDQIDLADSYRYFTAIVQEGQIPISRLPGLFDQISAAQRRLGARAAETLPAIARSLAAVQNAAGTTDKNTVLNQLIAIGATTQVATGQTGSSVGTALYRGAATFFPRQDNQQVLKSFGIDTSKGFTSSIIEAVRKAQSLQGDQRRQISQAFFGPQLGGRFASLFNREPQLTKALDETSPLKSQGSAAQELHKQLQRVDEQLARFGNTLQRIGAGLGQAGVFAPLGLVLKTINEVTGGIDHLIDAFDHVPPSIRKILVGVLEVAAAMKLLRTGFGTAAADAVGLGALGASRETRDRRQTIVGLRGTEQSYANTFEQNANRAGLLRQESLTAKLAAQQARDEAAALEAQGLTNATKGQHAALLKQATKLDDESATLERQSLAAEQRNLILQDQLNATRARITALQKGEAVTIEESRAAAALTGAATAGAGAQVAGARAAGAASSEVAAATTEAAVSSEALATKMSAAGAEMEASAAAQRAAAAEIVGVSGILGGISLGGVLTGALVGFTGFEVVKGIVDGQAKKIKEEAAKLATPSTDAQQLEANTRAVARAANAGFDHLAANAEQLQRDASALAARKGVKAPTISTSLPRTAGGGIGRGGVNVGLLNQIVKQNEEQVQAVAQTSGLSDNLYGRSYKELNDALQKGAKRFEGHPDQFEAYYVRVINAAHHSIDVLTGRGKGLDAALAALSTVAARYFVGQGPTKADPFAQFRGGTLDQNQQNLDLIPQRTQIGQKPRAPISTLAKGFVFDTSRFGNSSNPDVIKKLADEQQQITDYVQNQVAQITAGVSNLPKGRQGAVYQRAIDAIRRGDRQLGQAFKDRNDQLNDARKKLTALETQAALSGGDQVHGGGRVPKTPFDSQIRILQLQIRQFETNLAITKRAVALAEKALRNLIREQQAADAQAKKEQAQADQEAAAQATADARTLLESQNRYATSQVGTKGQGASNIAGLKRVLAFDRSHGAGKSTILDDLSAINEANNQINDSLKSAADDAKQKAEALYQAQTAARLAATDDPIKRDRIQLASDVHLLRGQARGSADFYNQLAAVRNDRRQLTQDIAQEDISQADFEHTIGKLTDEQYVRQLRNILKTKHLSRDLRRQLLTQIYQLNHQDAGEGALDLNVGNIRLPSLYDVRRLGKQGLNGAQSPQIAVHQSYTFSVRNDSDIERLGGELHQIYGGTVRAAQRSAGLR